jgi:alpha-tubulin suppressor-like RCC1 family protein
MVIHYYDDPVEEPVVKPKKPRAILGYALLLLGGGLFLNTTLAADININTGGKIEFGQGMTMTAACSGSTALTVTPQSTFVNASGSGAFYFNSVAVSGIPASCEGVDFQISAYDSTTSIALPLFGFFGENKSVSTVYNNGGYFQQGFQSPGTGVSTSNGAFTVTFKAPVALSSDAVRLTLQSTDHKDWAEASFSSLTHHTCALLNSSAVKCWGLNANGQLGNGTTTNSSTPGTVSGLSSGVSAIASGYSHSCAVLITGAVKCWGLNSSGQLGDNSTSQRLAPVDVSGLSSVRAITAGQNHTCALLRTGAVKCWGSGGRTGDGSGTQRLTPVDVSGLSSGVSEIASGWNHTCAVLSTGAVRCWGDNDERQSGSGGGGTSPQAISGLSASAIAIAAAEKNTCVLLSSGAVQCWGANAFGGTGAAPSGSLSNPQTVSGISNAVAISGGSETFCALLSSGAVKCWGYNGTGAFGNGTTTSSHIPVTVPGISAVAIETGWHHSCALLSSGAAKCWGGNGYGQLGDNSTTQRLSPVNVTGLP